MRIASTEILHCAAGTRVWSYLKMTTDDGLSGWAEFADFMFGARGVSGVIEQLAALIVGEDPLNTRRLEQLLLAATHEADGGLNRRARGTLLNATLDIRARAAGVSVADLLGGVVHRELPLYWSHCGLGRMRLAQAGEHQPLRTLDDVVALGREVREAGYSALKTNLILFGDRGASLYLPARDEGDGSVSRELSAARIARFVDLVAAFREGAGPHVDVLFDANFNVKGEAVRRLAFALEAAGVSWFEIDSAEPEVLRSARGHGMLRVASGESLSGVREYRRHFEAASIDVPIVDISWNGIPEATRIADLADSFDLNIAPHNFASHLLTHMNAQFAASLPNLAVLEYDVDGVPWRDQVVSPPTIIGGTLVVGEGPGWGCEIDEDAIRAHPYLRAA